MADLVSEDEVPFNARGVVDQMVCSFAARYSLVPHYASLSHRAHLSRGCHILVGLASIHLLYVSFESSPKAADAAVISFSMTRWRACGPGQSQDTSTECRLCLSREHHASLTRESADRAGFWARSVPPFPRTSAACARTTPRRWSPTRACTSPTTRTRRCAIPTCHHIGGTTLICFSRPHAEHHQSMLEF